MKEGAFLEDLLYSLNIVLPLFLVGACGYISVKRKIVDRNFMTGLGNLNYKLFMPTLLFTEIYHSTNFSEIDIFFILYGLIGIVIAGVVAFFGVKVFVKEKYKRGAIAQGVFRSNFILLGVAVIESMYGSESSAYLPTMMPFAIAAFNVMAIITLVLHSPEESDEKRIDVFQIVKKIISNPLIIAIVSAVLLLILDIRLPYLIETGIDYLARATTPTALISIGGTFELANSLKNLKYSLTTTIIRLIIVPIIGLTGAVLLGFRGEPLAVYLLLFGAPTAVSSAAMTRGMGGDGELSADITMITTLFSTVTLFMFIYAMRVMGLV